MAARSTSTAPTRVTKAGAVLARGLVVLCALLVGLLVLVTPASAYWSTAGSGVGSGSTGTLAAPTGVSVPMNSLPSVAVTWTASTGSPAPTGYYITRTSGVTTTAACASSASTLLTGTSCTDLGVPDGAYTYTVTAKYRSWSAASAPSGSVSVWTPAKVAFTGQPSNTVAGTGIVPSVAVTVETTAGVPVPLAGTAVTVAIGANPGAGTLTGTLSGTTNSSGVVTFAGLSINKSGVGYTLTASSSGLTAGTSNAFNILAATADRFAITSTAISGTARSTATLGPITVQRQDPLGNPAAPATAEAVNLSSTSNGASFSATFGGGTTTSVTIPASASSTTFYYADTIAGSPTIGVGGALAGASQGATISAGTAVKFVITSAAITAGVASATATIGPLTVQRQDALGNPATPAGAETVTLASNSTGTKFFSATSGGSSTTTVTIPANSSSVSFYYADTKAGGPTITVSGGLTGTTQNETIVAAAADRLLITSTAVSGVAAATATLGAITVERRDPFNNLVTAGSTTVNLSSNSGGVARFAATSGGAAITTMTITNGNSNTAFFYGDTKAASPVITVGASGLTGATQTATITPDVAVKLAFGQQPTSTSQGTNFSPAVSALIQDQFGNLTAGTATVTIAIATNAGILGLGVLNGTTAKPAVTGTATFSDINITSLGGLHLAAGNGYTLKVTSGTLTSATSTPFNIS